VPATQQFVGGYRMYHLIRAGAIYEIWAVRPMSETTAYAMKWLPPGPKYNRHNLADLKHEFQVGTSLDHRAVIRTIKFDTSSNGAYMLLELFKVLNLKQQIVAGYKKLQYRARDILIEAASGLAHFHEKGWIHRDIKPDNFLVSDENVVKLIDFNLARKPAGGLSKLFGGKTKTIQGTHSYMSPEQIRGQQLDARADIYSFGCVIYEVLAGKTPFNASTPNELLQRHLRSKAPDLTVIDKNITPDFSAYVQRMMAKDPKDRPANMKDVMMELKTKSMFYNKPLPPAPEEVPQKSSRAEEQ
jgi:serine/threonine-protein kinase